MILLSYIKKAGTSKVSVPAFLFSVYSKDCVFVSLNKSHNLTQLMPFNYAKRN